MMIDEKEFLDEMKLFVDRSYYFRFEYTETEVVCHCYKLHQYFGWYSGFPNESYFIIGSKSIKKDVTELTHKLVNKVFNFLTIPCYE